MGEMKERMLRGDLYIADDPDLAADFARAQDLVDRYNRTLHAEQATRDRILRELLGSVGEGVHIRAPFRCEYGSRVTVGARTFFNYDCVLLHVAPITVGSDCQIATRVQLLTATHPIGPSRGARSGSPASRSSSATTSGSAGASWSVPA